MNLRNTDSTLLFLSRIAEIGFVVAIVFAFASLLRAIILLSPVEVEA